MKWEKKGVIYCPSGESVWAQNSALTPTPFLLNDEVIRIFAGFRDAKGVSRIGYVDVAAENPSRVLGVSKEPVLDVGVPGAFDDNGVIMGDLLRVGDTVRMYYVGFQLVEKVKFLAFSGLAISHDGGRSFARHSNAPIVDRGDRALHIRAIHTVIKDGNKFRAWLGAGMGWAQIDGKPFPKYHVQYLESDDGIHFTDPGVDCITCEGSEYRIGRPRVFKTPQGYEMYYTKGNLEKDYLPGYAQSQDGKKWVRKDDEIGMKLSPSGWDSLHLCYTTPLTWRDKTYLFYNGNNMGIEGVGYALKVS